MPLLNNEHIEYIMKDLGYRGIILDGFQEEMIDHVCAAVEEEMAEGKRFLEAYHDVLKRFGHTVGLQQTQQQVFQVENKTHKLMLQNYLKIAFRNLSKHRFYSFINVMGLAIGVAACIIIALFVQQELSYDKHFATHDRIYRIQQEIRFGGSYYNHAVSSPPTGEAMANDFPEVETFARFRQQGSYLVKRDKDNFREDNVTYADSSVFKVFSIPFLQGNPNKALTEPNTIVISKKIADKYFPRENALGQSLIFFDDQVYKIAGVVEDMPTATHFHFDIFISMLNFEDSKSTSWLSNNYHTYLLLKEGSDAKALEAKLPTLFDKYIGPELSTVLNKESSYEKFEAAGNFFRFYMTPLTDIHLHSEAQIQLEPTGDITYVYLFGAIALFILMIACINFMNLSTARSANRAKEVGIRKVLGSLRSHLVRQFLMESIILSLSAFFLSLIIAQIALPAFNILAAKQLSLPFSSISFILIFLFSAGVVGFMAGIYPSFFLSGFKPVNVLKGKLALGMKSGWVRSALVIFQFTISIFLIVGTLAINKQLQYITNKKIGFNKDQVIIVKHAHALGKQLSTFKNEVSKDSRILNATVSGSLPVRGDTDRNNSSYWPAGKEPIPENLVGVQIFYVDIDYIKTMGMNVKEGRDFSVNFPSDSTAVILNEAAVAAFGFNNDVLSKKIETFRANPTGGVNINSVDQYNVIGVVEDFNFESLKESVGPLILLLSESHGAISFRFDSKHSQDVISIVEKNWKQLAPGQPFQYSFLDEDFGRMYSAEQRLGTIFSVFAGLAIVIACLGLFALTAFTAEQRTKEIGIRKVLGASISSIVLLLSKELGKLIGISFFIAAPLSWYAVNWWLEGYKYKTEVGILVYVLSGFSALLIAWLTMGYQSIKAAASDPVKSLRSE